MPDGKKILGTQKNLNFMIGIQMQFSIVWTINDCREYRNSSSSHSDILTIYSNGKVYYGSSSSYNDILYNYSDQLSIEEFVDVWHVVKSVYQKRSD
jgi:hypothetical protein